MIPPGSQEWSREIPMEEAAAVDSWEARLCAQSALPADGTAAAFSVDNRRIAVFCVAGKHYAVDDYCTHGGSSLSESGRLLGGPVVQCGLHRAQFDLATGVALRGPTRKPLRCYGLLIENDEVIAKQMPPASDGGHRRQNEPLARTIGADDG
jgi:nitrite reductase/ring-hydroxylating ferredoxin subunit